MEFVRRETEFVAGLHGRSGDPSPLTAFGVAQAIRAAACERYGDGSLDGARVSVQGLGSVGGETLRDPGRGGSAAHRHGHRWREGGADRRRLRAQAVAPEEIYDAQADIFAPCALGGVINDETIPRLQVDIVAGAANNQLRHRRHDEALRERGILYVPDYVGNAGGLINIYGERRGWSRARARAKVAEIFDTLCRVFALARSEATTPGAAADCLAEDRLAAARSAASSPEPRA